MCLFNVLHKHLTLIVVRKHFAYHKYGQNKKIRESNRAKGKNLVLKDNNSESKLSEPMRNESLFKSNLISLLQLFHERLIIESRIFCCTGYFTLHTFILGSLLVDRQ